MAKLPKLKKLIQEDFPSQKGWISKLLQPLNQFIETVHFALDKGLTINDNLDGQIAQVIVTGNEEVSFSIKTRSRPQGLAVTRVEVLDGVNPTASVWPIWNINTSDNIITISSWFGLDANTKYRITLLVHAG